LVVYVNGNNISDGNLVIYGKTKAVWSTGTSGRGTAPYKLVMQGDGNLVIYDKNGSVRVSMRIIGLHARPRVAKVNKQKKYMATDTVTI
jgi:hypothetical protein